MSSERCSPHSRHSPPSLAQHETPSELLDHQQKRQRQQQQQQQQPRGDDPESPMKPKRRRRLPTSDDGPPKNQIFYFVDSNSSSREKRAHVMRHHVQEKRRQRKASNADSDSDKTSSQGVRYVPWQDQKLEHWDSMLDGTRDSGINGASSGSSSVFRAGYPPLKASSHSFSPMPSPLPVNIYDMPRKEPISSLTVDLSREDLDLAEFWNNKLTYWSGQNKHMKDQIFQTAMGHPLALQAVILAYCARWKAQLYNIPEGIEVQRHVGQAARGIEDALRGATPIHEDHLAMALIGMALQEERFGQKQIAQAYIHQAVQILRSRAGSSNSVDVFLHYVRYIMTPPTPGYGIDPDGKQWLLTFLRGAEELMREHNTPAYLEVVPQRREAFQMDSPLFPLLSSGPRPSQVPLEARMYVVKNAPTQEITRTAALIYITAALWDFQDAPSKMRRFLTQIVTMVREYGLDRSQACETLVWLLLEERWDADLRDAERGWSTGELLKTHKQLRPDLQFQFTEILMSFLMMTPPLRGIQAFAEELNK